MEKEKKKKNISTDKCLLILFKVRESIGIMTEVRALYYCSS